VKVTLQDGSIVRRARMIVSHFPGIGFVPIAPSGIAQPAVPGTVGKIEKNLFEARATRTSSRTRAVASGGTVTTTGRLLLRTAKLG
jgi:hypothetical protein